MKTIEKHREAKLARAVTWGDSFEFQSVVEDACYALHFVFGRKHQMESAGHGVESVVSVVEED